jgi:hypothetical protein
LQDAFWIEQLKGSEISSINGFILRIKLNKEICELIQERSHCEFVFYQNIFDRLDGYHIKSNLRESILNLIGKIDEG